MALSAAAADEAKLVAIEAELDERGGLQVNETITFDGAAPTQLVQRFDTTIDTVGGSFYRHTIQGLKATADGVDLAPQVSTDGEDQVVTIDTAKVAGKPIVVTYTVLGAVRTASANSGTPAGREFHWPIFQGLSVGAQQVTGTVKTPVQISFLDCEAGTEGATQPCSTFQGGQFPESDPQFTDGPRAAGDQVMLTLGLPASVASNADVDQRWSLDRAFSVNPRTLLASLLPLLAGGLALWALHRRTGRDQVDPRRVTPVAEFRPVGAGESEFTVRDEVRPGHIGTVADERVDPIDVTASLLDLAVRGWLRIIELPQAGEHKPLDWTFERRAGGQGELAPFERELLDAVAPLGEEPARVSQISAAVGGVVQQVQSSLYDDVVRRGWFERRPDQTRSRWTTIGWVALAAAAVVAGLLVALTTYGLVGLALLLLAIGVLVVGQEMPRRTAAGASLLGGLSSLASQLQTQPTDQLPRGREYAELSRVLPYAVVLGGKERWLQAMVDADRDETSDGEDLDWYRAPGSWHLRDLPDALDAFIVSVQGQLFGR